MAIGEVCETVCALGITFTLPATYESVAILPTDINSTLRLAAVLDPAVVKLDLAKGKTPEQSDAIREGAEALIAAGVFAIVLESVMPATARELTASLSVPTIGIGCGDHSCDGEVAVITDVLGSFPWFVPPFAKPEADLTKSIRHAASQYIARVQNR